MRAARYLIEHHYGQNPDSDSDLYDAADMMNAFLAGAEWADEIKQGG